MIEGLGSSRRDGSQRSGAKGAVDDGRDWRVEQDCACLKSVTRAPVLLLKRFPLEVDLTCSPRIPCAAFGAQNGTLGGSVLARRSREAPLTEHHLFGLEAPFTGGIVMQRGVVSATQGSGNVRIVLKGNGSGGWYILTGFPLP